MFKDVKDRQLFLHQPFEGILRTQPDHLAIIAEDRRLSYGELGRVVASFAEQMRDAGVSEGDRVVLLMQKGWVQVASELAVSRLGAVFVPLSPTHPEGRTENLIRRVKPRVVCTEYSYESDIQNLVLDTESRANYRYTETQCRVDQVAYVLFTSGSTGIPKGVPIPHLGAVNTILDVNRRNSIGSGDILLALSEPTFDISIYDVFGTLGSGATLALPRSGIGLEPEALYSFIQGSKPTIWNSVPSLMVIMINYLMDAHKSLNLRLAMLSGDVVPTDIAGKIRGLCPDCQILSLGGVTEVSIWSTYHWVQDSQEGWSSVPYGRALSNQSVYILDENLEECPLNQEGEICFGGLGLAKGYFEDEEKSANAFINRLNEPIYRTGDLGMLRSDGLVEFLGRKDNCVKINGYRVELGELESRLRKMPNVRDAVAVGHSGALHSFLCSDDPPTLTEVQDFLSEFLPDYMLPSSIYQLDYIPLNENGKIDRKFLLSKLADRHDHKVELASNSIQIQLQEIYREILGMEVNNIGSNFVELGGNSIQAIRLSSILRWKFGISVNVRTILNSGSILDVEALILLRQDHSESGNNTTTIEI